MKAPASFDELIADGASVLVEGWDFSRFEGRATEERPSWSYADMVTAHIPSAAAVLDLQTGGGEVFAWILGRAEQRAQLLAATESWQPNVDVARRNLRPFGATVVEAAEEARLPFTDEHFDLVISRRPTVTAWDDLARVLRAGGTYLSQQVAPGSNRELTDFMMGPQPISQTRSPERLTRGAENAGMILVDLRQEPLRATFFDIGAVVHFLRKVLWTVPGFTVEQYRERLAALHEQIRHEGPFVTHVERLLIEVRRPR